MSGIKETANQLPEDVVDYSIYPVIPQDIDDDGIKDFLEKQIDAILAHLSQKLLRYIWQHECFRLRPVISSTDSSPPHLHGSTSFGDNIDDEWFIVSLLYEITREFAGTVVRVNDNDEEFLLIEAADALPDWLDPETAENRVYIYNGDLHVIPIPQSAEDFARYPLSPSQSEAVACVRDCVCDTRCCQAVQNSLNKRLSALPGRVSQSVHRVNCHLPTPLAVLLAEHPGLVAAGVRSFYYRDALELKACRPMKRFGPGDVVRTRVTMTRCLYAQLVQQMFTPDKRSGWTVVPPSNPDFLDRDIGIKLAHGFEILCSRCRDVDSMNGASDVISDSDVRWMTFKRSLTSQGYFRGEIEGSKLYQELTRDAKNFFASQIKDDDSLDSENVGAEVLRLIRQLQPKMEECRTRTRDLPPSDGDSWMNVSPEEVDEMMRSMGGTPGSTEPMDLTKIAESMSAFVEHESGLDGAEFPQKKSQAKEPEEDGGGGGDGQFEGGGLIQAMQKMFDFPDEKDSSDSEMSEYDWSEGSDDELGSPTKMRPASSKKSNIAKPKPSANDHTDASNSNSKSVHFQPIDDSLSEQQSDSTTANGKSSSSPVETGTDSPTPPPRNDHNRPANLKTTPSRPSQPPPPRPSTHPSSSPATTTTATTSPAPTRPPRRPISKPSGLVKPRTAPPPPPSGEQPEDKPSKGGKDKKLIALMEAMDRELAGTDVGKSFERTPKQTKPKPKRPPPPKHRGARDINDEDDDFSPVNVDLTVVKNTLESFKAQQGLPGPASNILSGLGITLPPDEINGGM